MRTAAILPIKRFSAAKQRLRGSVADGRREQLALAMASDVLDALAAVAGLDAVVVVTSEPAMVAFAHGHRALVVPDPGQAGQSAAAALGIERAVDAGAQRVLLVPGDCPALDPAEVAALLDPAPADGGDEVVIVPDRHGTGTNALLLTPPGAIGPSFGPGSCARHAQLARDGGVTWRIERLSSLLLDVDTAGDLDALRERLAHPGPHAQLARRTRALLAAAA